MGEKQARAEKKIKEAKEEIQMNPTPDETKAALEAAKLRFIQLVDEEFPRAQCLTMLAIDRAFDRFNDEGYLTRATPQAVTGQGEKAEALRELEHMEKWLRGQAWFPDDLFEETEFGRVFPILKAALLQQQPEGKGVDKDRLHLEIKSTQKAYEADDLIFRETHKAARLYAQGNLATRPQQPAQEVGEGHNGEWFFRWIARGKAGYCGMTMEQCADMIWHSPENPYSENNPWADRAAPKAGLKEE